MQRLNYALLADCATWKYSEILFFPKKKKKSPSLVSYRVYYRCSGALQFSFFLLGGLHLSFFFSTSSACQIERWRRLPSRLHGRSQPKGLLLRTGSISVPPCNFLQGDRLRRICNTSRTDPTPCSFFFGDRSQSIWSTTTRRPSWQLLRGPWGGIVPRTWRLRLLEGLPLRPWVPFGSGSRLSLPGSYARSTEPSSALLLPLYQW